MPKVLIVDDEKSLLLSLKTGLEEYKDRFEVLVAENGKEALKIIESTQIDLLITDLKMPVMNGFELLAHVFSNFPKIVCVVMTAFNTPDIEQKLSNTAMTKLIEKPVDIDAMINVIINNIESKEKGIGLPGISLSNYLQLLSMEGKTCVIEVQGKKDKVPGLFYFNKGQLHDATYKKLKGETAAKEMLKLDDPKIFLKNVNPKSNVKKKIKNSLMAILLESAKNDDEQKEEETDFEFDNDYLQLIDNIDPEEEKLAISEEDVVDNDKTNTKKGDKKMAKTEGVTIESVLEKFKVVSGFLAVGAFSPNGEVVAEVNASGVKVAEIGALANDVLLKAQKATEIMEVGRGQMVHVEAPKAHIFARSL
ncbi:MAG: response regulator, partial [Desulfobacteraceae bacterium]|nr:response regulator [Desulfobacteraceae bacterium]